MTEYKLHTAPHNSSFVFYNSNKEVVGRFNFKDGVMTFTGNADQAAHHFLDSVAKQYAGEYARLIEENDRLKRTINDLETRLAYCVWFQ